ncbi:MAG TPA: universal stress protein [Steroidobacteraceae bacterium]|jgi:nucleotide-binding universal stress UspA family protein|nr:universal stress protein [Steroidobacteraceae bacterium]
MFKRILLCYDGSVAGRRALRRGADLAIFLKAQVFVLCIIPAGALDPVLAAVATGHPCIVDEEHGYRKILDESVEWLKARGVAAEGYLTGGNTIDRILEYSDKLAIDLIVLGYYPRSAGGYWWWSSTSRATLAERARCCILVAVDPRP